MPVVDATGIERLLGGHGTCSLVGTGIDASRSVAD
jgi:hypothetical protein